MIHDTFKHGIFNLINFLRTKKNPLDLIKKHSVPSKTSRTTPRTLFLWCCKSQAGPGSCSSTRVGTKCDFINARLAPHPAFPWELGHRAQGDTKEDRNEALNCCIVFNYPHLKRGSHYCFIVSSSCKAGWISVTMVPKDGFCLLLCFSCCL